MSVQATKYYSRLIYCGNCDRQPADREAKSKLTGKPIYLCTKCLIEMFANNELLPLTDGE